MINFFKKPLSPLGLMLGWTAKEAFDTAPNFGWAIAQIAFTYFLYCCLVFLFEAVTEKFLK